MRGLIPLLSALVVLLTATVTHAVPIAFEYSGHLTSSRAFGGRLDHQPGDPFWGTIDYDREAQRQGAPGYVSYTFAFGQNTLAGVFDEGIFAGATPDTLRIEDHDAGFFGIYAPTLRFAAGVLSAPAELPRALGPGDFLGGSFNADFGRGEIDQLRVVPEPSTLLLLGAAAGITLAWRRLKRPRAE